ncbi:ABC transporter permease [uncultured Helicobacter sp.]|uniref:ABC transporter permease n=1 Tax=uncultured Helicobacter sp. TaxID=175537 RepID=UPI0037535561
MRFLYALMSEYKAIFTNRVVVLVVVVGSMVYGLLYPMPYLHDIVTKQKLLIVDEDKSTLSRDLIFLVSATPQIELVAEVPNLTEAQAQIETFQANGVLFIPQGFESNAYLGVGTIISYMGNASYFLIYGAIVEGIHNAIDSLSQRIYELHHLHALSTDSISYEAIPLYNPSLGYINYALAAVLVFILHQTLIGGSAILTAYQNRLAKESRDLTRVQGAYWNHKGYIEICKIVLVRILAFSSIYCLWFLFYFGVLFVTFGVNIHASMGDFWCFGIIFIMCCSACGVLLGALLEDESLPTQIVFISSMPLVFIMGFIWPSELLPNFLRELSYLIPAYHGIRGLVSLNQMGANLSDVVGHMWALGGIGIFCVVTSIFVLSYKRKDAS